MSSRHLQAMLLRLAGSFIAVVGVWAVLAWNPALCVVPAIGCASPPPGQTSSCVPPIPTCTNEYVPLRLGSALLSVAVGIALFVLAWRRERDGAPQGTIRTPPAPSNGLASAGEKGTLVESTEGMTVTRSE